MHIRFLLNAGVYKMVKPTAKSLNSIAYIYLLVKFLFCLFFCF